MNYYVIEISTYNILSNLLLIVEQLINILKINKNVIFILSNIFVTIYKKY